MAKSIENLENAFDEMFDFITDLPSGLDGFESDFDSAFEELREVKATLTPPNEPLTCEELREMDGEAIYWPKNKMWLIVYLNHPDFGDCAVNREGQYLQLEKCEKQKVYRRQPEGEEDT